ncbi:MAG: 2-hydroxyacid dehydrogenase, partial [Clostridiales bacterium]|nr:2-hydroxyacid dehydrogenase [Clostridiales bacterium]
MRILFYDAKKYDVDSFDKELVKFSNIEVEYLDTDLSKSTVALAKGYDAVCAFVSSDCGAKVLEKLNEFGIKLLLLRCAGFNNVDVEAANKYGITVLRVPGYSPEAVAEFAITIALAVNRHLHKSYIKVRENNFALTGLTGINFFGKTAGIIGTGKIGAAMCRICQGLGMKVIAYDAYVNPNLDFVEYKTFDEVLAESDLISLHCPLTEDNYHMINKDTIAKMKDNVILVNT